MSADSARRQLWPDGDDDSGAAVAADGDRRAAPTSSRSRRRLLHMLHIELGGGKSGTIRVREGDDTFLLAEEFVATHGLASSVVDKLAAHLNMELVAHAASDKKKAAALAASPKAAAGSGSSGRPAGSKKARRSKRKPRAVPSTMDAGAAYSSGTKAGGSHGGRGAKRAKKRKKKKKKADPAVFSRLYGEAEQMRRRAEDRRRMVDEERHVEPRPRLSERTREISDSIRAPGGSRDIASRLYADGMRYHAKKRRAASRPKKAAWSDALRGDGKDGKDGKSAAGRASSAASSPASGLHGGRGSPASPMSPGDAAATADWRCPVCAFVNDADFALCQNIVASDVGRICGQPQPELFRPRISALAEKMVRPPIYLQDKAGAPIARPAARRRHRWDDGEDSHHASTLLPSGEGGSGDGGDSAAAAAAAASASAGGGSSGGKGKAVSGRDIWGTAHAAEDSVPAGEECTFAPTLNPRSRELAERRALAAAIDSGSAAGDGSDSGDGGDATRHDGGGSAGDGSSRRRAIHESLYREAETRALRRIEMEEERLRGMTFHPDIGLSNRVRHSRASSDDFVERMAAAARERDERLAALQEAAARRDPKTGEEYFKPKTGRSPYFPRNAAGLPIGDFLFATRHEYDDIKDKLAAEEAQELQAARRRGHVNPASRRLLKRMLRRQAISIFAALVGVEESDEDAVTAAQLATNEAVVEAVEESLQPRVTNVLAAATAKDMDTLTFAQFAKLLRKESRREGAKAAAAAAGAGSSGAGARSSKRRAARRAAAAADAEEAERSAAASEAAELTFRPKLDARSRRIAARRRRGQAGQPVHEKLLDAGARYEKRASKARAEVEAREAEELTFAPAIDSRSRRLAARAWKGIEQDSSEDEFDAYEDADTGLHSASDDLGEGEEEDADFSEESEGVEMLL